MSTCVTPSQPVYVFPRQRRGFTDRSLATEAPRLSTLHNGSSGASPAQRTFILFPGNKRAKAHGGSPAREVPFSALPDQERETNLPHFRGPRLGWRFLMVQAVYFFINLCLCHAIPTPTSAGIWRVVTSPPRVLYRGLRWLRGEPLGNRLRMVSSRFSMDGFPKRQLKQYRERNEAKAKELKELAFERVRQCDTKGAVKLFQQASRCDQTDIEITLQLSKCLSDRVFEQELFGTWKAKRLAAQAVRISKKALRSHPDSCLAHVCHATNLGRLSMFSENKERVKIAGEVRERALSALQLDPHNDLAHHILGRWEYEMAGLGPVIRAFAKMLFGDLGNGSFERATRCFESAAESSPNRLIHRVMLAKCYMKTNHKSAALEQLNRAMKLPVEDICAQCERTDGVELLKNSFRIEAPPAPAPGQALESPSLRTTVHRFSTNLVSELKRVGSKDALLREMTQSFEKARTGIEKTMDKSVETLITTCETAVSNSFAEWGELKRSVSSSVSFAPFDTQSPESLCPVAE